MKILPEIMQRTIMFCMEKRERSFAYESVMKAAGVKTCVATGVYDALRIADQEMPHLIVSEPSFVDGTASLLFDRLQQSPVLARIPMAILVGKMAKDEAQALMKRRLAGLITPSQDSSQTVGQIQKILMAGADASPHFLAWPEFSPPQARRVQQAGEEDARIWLAQIQLALEAAFVGRCGDMVIARTSCEIDTSAPSSWALRGVANSAGAMFNATALVNYRFGQDVLVGVPLTRICGLGHNILAQLPDVHTTTSSNASNASAAPQVQKNRRAIVMDADLRNFSEIQTVLGAYGWEAVQSASSAALAQLLRNPASVACVVVHGSDPVTAFGVEARQVFASVPAQLRPPLLFRVANGFQKSADQVRYVNLHGGIGTLLESLEAVFVRSTDLQKLSTLSGSSAQGTPAAIQASAAVIGCDEHSWYFVSLSPFAKGTRLSLATSMHDGKEAKTSVSEDLVKKLMPSQAALTVGACIALPPELRMTLGRHDLGPAYQVRIDVAVVGLSKARYWEKLNRDLQAGIQQQKAG